MRKDAEGHSPSARPNGDIRRIRFQTRLDTIVGREERSETRRPFLSFLRKQESMIVPGRPRSVMAAEIASRNPSIVKNPRLFAVRPICWDRPLDGQQVVKWKGLEVPCIGSNEASYLIWIGTGNSAAYADQPNHC